MEGGDEAHLCPKRGGRKTLYRFGQSGANPSKKAKTGEPGDVAGQPRQDGNHPDHLEDAERDDDALEAVPGSGSSPRNSPAYEDKSYCDIGDLLKIASSSFLVVGLGGLGAEVTSHLLELGAGSITLMDWRSTEWADISVHRYLDEKHLGMNRASATLACLQNAASVTTIQLASQESLTRRFIAENSFDVIIVTTGFGALGGPERLDEVLDYSHQNNIPTVVSDSRGLSSLTFCDFGQGFVFEDYASALSIETISKGQNAMVTCRRGNRKLHNLANGDMIKLEGINGGMNNLNGIKTQVKVTGANSFSLEVDTRALGDYEGGGQAVPVKVINFNSFKASLKAPMISCEVEEDIEVGMQLILAHKAVEAFRNSHDGNLPRSWNSDDANEVLEFATLLATKLEVVPDNRSIRTFSYVAKGQVYPVVSFSGALAAGEVVKACTKKSPPLFQWHAMNFAERIGIYSTLSVDENGSLKRTLNELDYAMENRSKGVAAVFGGGSFIQNLASLNIAFIGTTHVDAEFFRSCELLGIGSNPGGGIITVYNDEDSSVKETLSGSFPTLNIAVSQVELTTFSEELRKHDILVIGSLNENDLKTVDSQRVLSRTLFTRLHGHHLLTSSVSGSVPLHVNVFPASSLNAVTWAKELFRQNFIKDPEHAVQCLTEPEGFFKMIRELPKSEAAQILANTKRFLGSDFPLTIESCIEWARNLWDVEFNVKIQHQEMGSRLIGYMSESVSAYINNKEANPLLFEDDTLGLATEFVFVAANLRAKMFGMASTNDLGKVKRISGAVKLDKIPPISLDDILADAEKKANADIEFQIVELRQLIDKNNAVGIYNLSEGPILPLRIDGAAEFILLAGHLRSLNFNLRPPTSLETRQLLNSRFKVSSAFQSTFAASAGCLELLRMSQDKAIDVRTIHQLSYKGDSESLIHILLHQHVNLEDRNSVHEFKDVTPLFAACRIPSISCIEILIGSGADVNCNDGNGNSALHYLSLRRDTSEDFKTAIYCFLAAGARRCEMEGKSNGICPLDSGCVCEGEYVGTPPSYWCLQFDGTNRATISLQKHDEDNINAINKSPPVAVDSVNSNDIGDDINGNDDKSDADDFSDTPIFVGCDGGGSLGVNESTSLDEIEKELNKMIKEEGAVRQLRINDIIGASAGTSAGAICVSALALNRDSNDIGTLFITMAAKVFKGFLQHGIGPLKELLKKEFGEFTRLTDLNNVILMTTKADEHPARLKMFTSYGNNDSSEGDPVFLWEIVTLSASAIPLIEGSSPTYIDGAFCANNPCPEAIIELRKLKKLPKIIISLGTGIQPLEKDFDARILDVGQSTGFFDFLYRSYRFTRMLGGRATDSNGSRLEFSEELARAAGSTYYRFNPPLPEEFSITERDPKQLMRLRFITRCYMKGRSETVQELCREILKYLPPPKP